MRIGLFTDTYFPQVSGVATSIRTLKTELEKLGHKVFIFTTTDKDVNRYEDWQIIRIPSVPFFAFKDRRVAYRGFSNALEIARQYPDRVFAGSFRNLDCQGTADSSGSHLPYPI